MGLLKNTLKKHKISEEESKIILSYAKEYVKEGYTGKDANIEAIKDYLQELEDEKENIMKQIETAIKGG